MDRVSLGQCEMLPFPSLLPIICISFGIFVFFAILLTFWFADFLVTLFIVFFSYSCQYFLSVLNSKVYNPFFYIKKQISFSKTDCPTKAEVSSLPYFFCQHLKAEFFLLPQKTVDLPRQRGQVFSFTDTFKAQFTFSQTSLSSMTKLHCPHLQLQGWESVFPSPRSVALLRLVSIWKYY